MGHIDAQRSRYDGFDLEQLKCYGCAHSAAGEPPPGRPSGERPCGFCIRNWNRMTDESLIHLPSLWYDGSEPVCHPMDCYQTLDMKLQTRQWLDEAESAGAEALNRLIDLHGRMADKKKASDGST